MPTKLHWYLVLTLNLSLLGAERPEAAAGRSQGRSMVVSTYGIVATEHPLASQAGALTLSKGGNAMDAAVAANAAIGVLSPMSCGIGGDMFAIVYEAKSRRIHGLNASGWAPAAMSPELLKAKGFTNMPQTGIFAVTVPGAVDGWDKLLRRFGRKRFAEVLEPAIAYAEKGVPVPEWISAYWSAGVSLLKRDTNAANTYLPNGRAPRLGEVFRNLDLAQRYREIAAQGRRAFYEGSIAQRLAAYSQQKGGCLTVDDFSQYQAEWVDPVSTTYRGWTVYEMPPNGQGIGALMMLNLMEQFRLTDYGHNSVSALHVMIEAKKLAYADLLRYVADPRFSKVPVTGLLSKEYARQRAKLIETEKANPQVLAGTPPESGNDTTYLCVVDAEGNMVSLIQSNYGSFGSGLVADGAGFVLQNRGGLFSLDPSHPNALAGRKRPLHTIIPAMMAKGDVGIAFGIMGGWNQSQAHAQFVSNVADHHLNIQAALEAPRFTKLSFAGNDVQLEGRIPAAVRQGLEAKGHQVQMRGDYNSNFGGGQAVLRDFTASVNYGASDPRKDGAAVPQPFPQP